MRRLLAACLAGTCLQLHAGVGELERFFQEATASDAPPSVSLAVLHGSEIVYERGFGFNDRGRNHPTTAQSVYNLYSLSKIVTATVVMELAGEGRIDLDAPIQRYFPRFRTFYEAAPREITVAQLLSHSAGVTDRSGDYRHLFDDARDARLRAEGGTPAEGYELAYEPGSEARYANSDFIILGYLVEKVTGISFEEAVRERVLLPAGMERSGFEMPAGIGGDEVFGTLRLFSWMGLAMRLMIGDADKAGYAGTMLWLKRYNVSWSAAGGLKGSAHDMAKFLQAMHTLTFFDEAVYRRFLFGEQVPVRTWFSKFDRVAFGIGWYRLENGGEMFYQHQGIGPGFRNIMRMYPGYDLSFVILTNQTGTDIDAWADRVFETFKEEFQ